MVEAFGAAATTMPAGNVSVSGAVNVAGVAAVLPSEIVSVLGTPASTPIGAKALDTVGAGGAQTGGVSVLLMTRSSTFIVLPAVLPDCPTCLATALAIYGDKTAVALSWMRVPFMQICTVFAERLKARLMSKYVFNGQVAPVGTYRPVVKFGTWI